MKFNTIVLLLAPCLLLASCVASQVTTDAIDSPEIVKSGGGRDENGCISSAGYQWSTLRKDCIRLCEAGTALINAGHKASTAATLVNSVDSQDLELFIAGKAKSLILIKSGAHWTDTEGIYKLIESKKGIFELYNNEGVILYRTKL